MFTGIVDDIGTIERTLRTDAGLELRVACGYESLEAGESIALNGVCLTVREPGDRRFTVAAVGTTLERTTLGGWTVGTRVNLERAMIAGDRLGGHIVQGHVDGVGRVEGIQRGDDRWLANIAVSDFIAELMVPHGALAVDGVSLTVNDLPAPDIVQLSLIAYTLSHTTLGALRAGDLVHVECDVIGKYVQRLLAPYLHQEAR